jgi:Sec7-like guanine-nucleotide exchange factor
LKGAELFNQSAKKGIPFFQGNYYCNSEHGFLPKPLTPEAMAIFFATSSNLSKAVIGDYLGRPDKSNQETLAQFVKLFNFEGVNFY